MKPFNLEEAKRGKPVCTRDGKDVRIICFDRDEPDYPIIALVRKGNCEQLCSYTLEGYYCNTHTYPQKEDLMMKSEKREGWINIFNQMPYSNRPYTSLIYNTKEEALEVSTVYGNNYKNTIKIEWEE